MAMVLKTGIWSIYVLAVTVGVVCTGYSLYVLLAFAFIAGWGTVILTFIPAFLNALFLVLVLRLVLVKRWRKYMYGPQAWVLVLLIGLIVAFMNYAYMVSLRGI